MAEMSSVEYLELSENNLSGAIPPELGSLSNLTSLYLNENRLSGAIPPELGDLVTFITCICRIMNFQGRFPGNWPS